jgi:nucleoside-diphosphate-sugar epimerase
VPGLSTKSPATARSTLSVALTGASGTLGPSLLGRLDATHAVGRVVVIGRRQTDSIQRSAKAEFVRADVRDRAAVRSALAGADVIVHAAFALYGVSLGEAALFETNVRGTLHVAEAAAEGARRLVLLSSAAVYGRGGTPEHALREDAPLAPPARLFYARHKAQSELVAAQALRGTATQAYVLRPCGIVGPHAAGVVAHRAPGRLAARLRTAAAGAARVGVRPLIPAPAVPLQFVHEDDVAQAVVRAVEGTGPAGTYNLAGEGWLDGPETLRTLGLRRLPLPPAGARAALAVLGGVPPLVPAIGWSELVREPVILDTSRARSELGWRPRFSSRAALAATRAALGW